MERKMFFKSAPLLFKMPKQGKKTPAPGEMLLWDFLKKRPSGYKFRPQYPLYNYIVDFFCLELQLVIEVEGPDQQHPDLKMKALDRQEFLASKNIKVVSLTEKEITENREEVIKYIHSILETQMTVSQ